MKFDMKFNFIQSGFSFGHKLAGYRDTIEIRTFQLANNGPVVGISPFVRPR